jgi:hypothetical protein
MTKARQYRTIIAMISEAARARPRVKWRAVRGGGVGCARAGLAGWAQGMAEASESQRGPGRPWQCRRPTGSAFASASERIWQPRSSARSRPSGRPSGRGAAAVAGYWGRAGVGQWSGSGRAVVGHGSGRARTGH